MKITQLVKQLNNTELGKGGTHDTYVLIPNELDITDIFETAGKPIEFTDCDTEEKVVVRNTVGREKRIVGLGQYYRSKGLNAGDELIFERRAGSGKDEFIVRVKKLQDHLVVQKARQGFEVLTPDRMKMAESWNRQLKGSFKIEFIQSAKKRNDSPDTTDYYDIYIGGKSILNDYSGKELGLLSLVENQIIMNSYYGWKKYEIEVGGNYE